ncbi:MAG: cation:proton antiporter [Alicyclobacillaceae bacterium]|nr:cation:proton antiporter [Alicyclobacillaceae bacterium]
MLSLSSIEMARLLLSLMTLLVAANVLGYLAEQLAIPRVIGEVASGLLLGPTLLGHFLPELFHWLYQGFPAQGKVLGFLYQLGLILLMFTSGLKFQSKFDKSDISIGVAVVLGSTVLPFIAGWIFMGWLDPSTLLGPAHNLTALKIVVAISIAVTSIPVISKILYDLGVMHTRFAKLVVTIAGVHDTFLWVALAVASGLVTARETDTLAAVLKSTILTLGFIGMCFFVMPKILRRINAMKANILFRASFLGYVLFILLFLTAFAGYLGVDIMFGALLAGVATRLGLPRHLFERVENSVREISFSFFIPLYFAMVGLQLDLATQFSLSLFLIYLLFATVIQTGVVYGTCRLIRMNHLSSLNLAAAMNARGGPGIVLSTVAYSLGIINQTFFAVLVMLALVTSWMAGAWLRYVLKTGRPLMPGDEQVTIIKPQEEARLQMLSGTK